MTSNFNKKLIEWHDPDARRLPWKQSHDPYKIWLSEIILQQTRVEQGTPYYLRFIKKFPTVRSLADSPLDSILKLWEGLGYYSRARNLHTAAREVVEKHKGKFPAQYEEIRALKGIGDYTAAAIASFAYNQPHAVVDGNVYRVLARVFRIELPIDSTSGKKYFKELAEELLDRKNPGLYNQAIMDLGATICKPKNPDCKNCPLSSDCKAYLTDTIPLYPVKSKALLKKDRHFHYYVITDGKQIIINQRQGKDIWQQLFEFPMTESKTSKVKLPDSLKIVIPKLNKPFTYRQVLSHQNIHGYFYETHLKSLKKIRIENSIVVDLKQLKMYAFPKIINLYLQERLKCLS